MPRIERLQQNTLQWSSWRLGGIGASDAPIVMGTSRWMSPKRLWEVKTGKATEPARHNLAVRRGHSLENSARRAYEAATSELMEPHCLTHDHLNWMHASLDGLNFDRSLVLEIKCPQRGVDHATAVQGSVPLHYYAQLQHQLEVSGARELHYWSFDGRRGALVRVFPDEGYIDQLVQAESEFWKRVTENRWPEVQLKVRDLSNDPAWVEAARRYREVQQRCSESEQQELQLRRQLATLSADAGRAFGGGIELVRSTRKGAVDYRAVPELKGIDLEPYRKPPVEVVRINLLSDCRTDG